MKKYNNSNNVILNNHVINIRIEMRCEEFVEIHLYSFARFPVTKLRISITFNMVYYSQNVRCTFLKLNLKFYFKIQ
jgi:hypothetical protein